MLTFSCLFARLRWVLFKKWITILKWQLSSEMHNIQRATVRRAVNSLSAISWKGGLVISVEMNPSSALSSACLVPYFSLSQSSTYLRVTHIWFFPQFIRFKFYRIWRTLRRSLNVLFPISAPIIARTFVPLRCSEVYAQETAWGLIALQDFSSVCFLLTTRFSYQLILWYR
jgi:hypothetical protein